MTKHELDPDSLEVSDLDDPMPYYRTILSGVCVCGHSMGTFLSGPDTRLFAEAELRDYAKHHPGTLDHVHP